VFNSNKVFLTSLLLISFAHPGDIADSRRANMLQRDKETELQVSIPPRSVTDEETFPVSDGSTVLWKSTVNGGADHFRVLVFVGASTLAPSVSKEQAAEDPEKAGNITLLDAETGKSKQVVSWSAPASASDFDASPIVVPLTGGPFMLKSWNVLKLFSSEGTELGTRVLPVEGVEASCNPKLTLWERWDLI